MPDWSPSILVPLYALQWIALLFLAALVLGAYNQIGQVQRTLSRRPSRLRPGIICQPTIAFLLRLACSSQC